MMTPDKFSFDMRIPRDRVGVLVGNKGKIKRKIENHTKTSLNIDSKEGIITIVADDGLKIYVAKEVVRAIGRGFNPEIATLLLKTDYQLEVISFKGIARNPNEQARIKGRVIGEGGKARSIIENLTGAYVVIYGKTVAILGEINQVITARKAIEMLITGSPHRNVYKYLERQKKSTIRRELLGID